MSRRIYGEWAGNPGGQREDETRCIASVPSSIGRGMVNRQCAKPRGRGPDGLWCGVHAGVIARGYAVCAPTEPPTPRAEGRRGEK